MNQVRAVDPGRACVLLGIKRDRGGLISFMFMLILLLTLNLMLINVDVVSQRMFEKSHLSQGCVGVTAVLNRGGNQHLYPEEKH